MAQLAIDAILIPSDGHRHPCLVQLMISSVVRDSQSILTAQPLRVPHPEIHMDYIAEVAGKRTWGYHVRYTAIKSAQYD
jgi:hypothetical protein